MLQYGCHLSKLAVDSSASFCQGLCHSSRVGSSPSFGSFYTVLGAIGKDLPKSQCCRSMAQAARQQDLLRLNRVVLTLDRSRLGKKKHPDRSSGCFVKFLLDIYSFTRTKRKKAFVPQFFSTWIPLPTVDGMDSQAPPLQSLLRSSIKPGEPGQIT